MFCKIASGEIKSHIVCESDLAIAFLDIFPVRPGHVLIMPRSHFAFFDEVPAGVMTEIMIIAQRLSRRLKELYRPHRVGLAVNGSDIAHMHLHVVPMMEKTDITSARCISTPGLVFAPPPRMPDPELSAIAERIRSGLSE
jgi:histidine triad (HIT) family protein